MKTFRNLSTSLCAAALVVPVLCVTANNATARGLDDQWYIGIAGSGVWLQPDPEEPGNNVDEAISSGGAVMLGKDLDERSSLQLQGFALGEAILDDGNAATYSAVDGSVVYRFYDSRDRNLTPGGFGASIYGRFALGYMQRESDTALERDSGVYFGVGGGVETYVTDNIAVRVEGFYHDIDAVSASLGLVYRFGGSLRGPSRIPSTVSAPAPAPSTQPSRQPVAPSSQLPSVAPAPAPLPAPAPSTRPVVPAPTISSVPQQLLDADRDGVPDTSDLCLSSTPGFPVRPDGCPLFDGVLSGIQFNPGQDTLAPGSDTQLNYLVDLLVNQYPQASIELHAHTDNTGDARSQAILTRGRLKTVGTYLVQRGVSANRLILRSFGGSRPLYDNRSAQGRASNNRFEVLEHVR